MIKLVLPAILSGVMLIISSELVWSSGHVLISYFDAAIGVYALISGIDIDSDPPRSDNYPLVSGA